jgi:bifunctional DNA-binding transcriptional regulator/antitoxin component of YhaV-PrlF toxin-antitoxin module
LTDFYLFDEYVELLGTLDICIAVLQYCSMAIAIPISKRGTVTIPPEFRKRLGVDKLENPMLLVEERDGKLYLEPAAAIPVRDIPKATLESWIAADEAEMTAFKKAKKRS